jgi:hypothetical protein
LTPNIMRGLRGSRSCDGRGRAAAPPCSGRLGPFPLPRRADGQNGRRKTVPSPVIRSGPALGGAAVRMF